MKASNNSYVKIFSTGFLVLTMMSLILYWIRWKYENSLVQKVLPEEAKEVLIQPSGLIPDEIEFDPNITTHSMVRVNMYMPKFLSLGIINYVDKLSENGRNSNVSWYFRNSDTEGWFGLYFDNSTGLIVYEFNGNQEMPDNSISKKQMTLYAGPEGVSIMPEKGLGKFNSQVVVEKGYSRRDKFILYDSKLRSFFRIDFDNKSVIKGAQLSEEDFHEPVQIGLLGKKYQGIINFNLLPPMETKGYSEGAVSQTRNIALSREYRYLPVLDKSGGIDLLDVETLTFAGVAGKLTAAESLYGTNSMQKAKDFLAYQVLPVAFDMNDGYRGICVATVNREGTAAKLSVFDKNGIEIQSNETKCRKFNMSKADGVDGYISTSKGIYEDIPWGPVTSIIKFSLENLHPPVLSLISYFTAYSFEAGDGHRAIFILPNSFVGMVGRNVSENAIERFIISITLIIPSIILSITLAWRVRKDAVVIGLSENERLFWIIGIITFGLVGYITYRLSRPKSVLVTCNNCGKTRRPDMEKCHQCKSVWNVPELTPPSWRVKEVPKMPKVESV